MVDVSFIKEGESDWWWSVVLWLWLLADESDER